MKVEISPFTFLYYALMLLLFHEKSLIVTLSAIAIHEAGHFIMIALSGSVVEVIEITPMGLIIRRHGLTAHFQDAAIQLAGPLMNFVTAGLLFLLLGASAELPVTVHLFFGLLNLLPIASLDGGKALYALLSGCCSQKCVDGICRFLSALTLLLLWMLSVALLLMTDGNPSLLLFTVGLFGSELTGSSKKY